ncbi:hypothetical protein [Streptomyces sp. NPDC051098]
MSAGAKTKSTSRLSVELHTERTEGDQIDAGLREALRGIKTAVEAAER